MAEMVLNNPVFNYAYPLFAPETCGLPLEPDGNWYFWDETWCDAVGPYETEAAADLALAEYDSQL